MWEILKKSVFNFFGEVRSIGLKFSNLFKVSTSSKMTDIDKTTENVGLLEPLSRKVTDSHSKGDQDVTENISANTFELKTKPFLDEVESQKMSVTASHDLLLEKESSNESEINEESNFSSSSTEPITSKIIKTEKTTEVPGKYTRNRLKTLIQKYFQSKMWQNLSLINLRRKV